MHDALLIDFINGACPVCFDESLLQASALNCHVFLLHGPHYRGDNLVSDRFKKKCKRVHVLDHGSITGCLYRFKQTVDELQLSAFKVLTSAKGRELMLLYQEQLFTAVCSFEFEVWERDKRTCPKCLSGPAPLDSPGGGEGVLEEVAEFFQQLPALKGEITVLKSTLIPGGV